MSTNDKKIDDVQILSQPRSWTELIGYQTGSIVSRTLVDKPAGTVTLFAFDSGQALSEHTAPYDALVWILDGEMEITVEGNKKQVLKGKGLLMPAHKPHALQAIAKSTMLLVMIKS